MEKEDDSELEDNVYYRLIYSNNVLQDSLIRKIGNAFVCYVKLQIPFIGDKLMRKIVRERRVRDGMNGLGRLVIRVGEPIFYLTKYGGYAYGVYRAIY